MKICQENQNLFKIGQKCRAFYLKISVNVIVPATLNGPKSALFDRNAIKLLE